MKNKIFLAIALLIFSLTEAFALPADSYATESRLATGKWVKVRVEKSGLYSISASQLKQWGFSDPSKVRVYGYGGARIPDALTEANYIDDLPLVQSVTDNGSIIFYGVGPEQWTSSSNGVLVNTNNIYTTAGYYFLSDTGEPAREPEQQVQSAAPNNPADTYVSRQHYEVDRFSPGEAGYLLVGESFKAQSTRKFTFTVPIGEVRMECGIVSNSAVVGTVTFAVNGKPLDTNSSDRLPATSSSTYIHGSYTTAFHKFNADTEKIELTVTVGTASSMRDCWLDYIAINADAPLEMPTTGVLEFASGPYCKMGTGGKDGITVWDVTNPLSISKINTVEQGDGIAWTNDYHGDRQYAAWAAGSKLPSPAYVGSVANQNIHGMESVDMVIFTLPAYTAQAQRLANMHQTSPSRPLKVAVLDVNQVYNEFASGAADVSALRKCLKMLYDRPATDSIPTIQYALLMGRATYDNRRLTSQFDSPTAHGTIPMWLGGSRSAQLSDNAAFGTDDFIAMLEDGSGSTLGADKLCVAVGRIPARSAAEMKSTVDKIMQYATKSKPGPWRNTFLFLADDGNEGEHVQQTETMINYMLTTPNSNNLISKVYVDAYEIVSGSCQAGRDEMYRMLDEGVVWWNYIGHANNHSWTAENMLNYNDINNLYLNNIPVLMAATCDFLRWDSNTLSGGEILFHERYGGTIATISATRPVYISENRMLTNAIGRSINKRNADGTLPRLGDIYRMAKNDIRNGSGNLVSSANRLRFVLMGDPAMQLMLPDNIVVVDRIGDKPVVLEDQVTLMALQRTTISGRVLSPDGKPMSDFNGTVQAVIYDAEYSRTTLGTRPDNRRIIFENHGDKLFAGSAPVVNGEFTINVAMPAEVANNFRPASINLFAYSDNATASGVNRDFYVYGLDESAPADTIAPKINYLYLNHESFKPGDTVNESPLLIASVSDDVSINLSSAGVGHQISVMLDGRTSYSDVAHYYTPSADGTPSGTVTYPLENLADGKHTLRFRVWDTAGNSASQEIDFVVKTGLTPTIYDVYCDASPARTETNFYITHDRPDGEVTVTVSVYNLLGKPIWSSTVTGRSDMFQSSPVNWDLKDNAGRRVPRGIYIYRAQITANGATYDTASRKLAVAAE